MIWADIVKSMTLVTAVALCCYFIARELGLSLNDLIPAVTSHPKTRMFFFDNPAESSFFWKEFIAGIFLVVAMTGLDQDMMQHTLSCHNSSSSRKNLALSSVLQFLVIALFLALGTLMLIYMEHHSIDMPPKTDDIFATVAFHESMPFAVGILFILGLVSASYSSVGSALTSLTTSFTVDIMEARKRYDDQTTSGLRKKVHVGMALAMIGVIIMFYYLNSQDAISAVFTLASYTYGPILGLFIFGIFFKKRVNPRWAVAVCFSAPVLSWLIAFALRNMCDYHIGYELLLLNAALIVIGLSVAPVIKTSIVAQNN